MSAPSGLELYTRTAREAAARVIRAYSTSFAAASRMLSPPVRAHVAAIYALVRVADEIVDGPAAEAGIDTVQRARILDELEAETLAAMRRGFSADLVVHAFAITAREAGIGEALVRPFFASMRMDAVGVGSFDAAAYRAYIHGSAEVVGSMCLRAFLTAAPGTDADADLEEGARRLGAAFQKVNFLRDVGDDHGRLGRSYFPGVEPQALGEGDKLAIIEDIEEDLRVARAVIPRLPADARRATTAAADLFAALAARLRETPAHDLTVRRVSVPTAVKARIVARALIAGRGRARP
ncbi:squalene/phytoene synthase family protein [Microbacterium sp. NPDC096154]|uniref:phytoene/squalene synthase family protein n=1 Tax=Microbacterium sp. NPDC096154 TaxID=3155549 RepID=UPI00332EA585